MRYITLLLTVTILIGSAHALSTPEQVIAAMHDRYLHTWYHSITLDQQATGHKPDGTTWTSNRHETVVPPDHLRIDSGDSKSGDGLLFVKGHEYYFHAGKLMKEIEHPSPLQVLSSDIYSQPVSATIGALKGLHFDLSVMHEEEWEGRAVYVIGAKAGDTHTAQFWIDKERLYFLRLLQPDENNAKVTQEFRYEEYSQLEGGWVAAHVMMFADGKLVFEEKYQPPQINLKVSEDLFDPQHFSKATP